MNRKTLKYLPQIDVTDAGIIILLFFGCLFGGVLGDCNIDILLLATASLVVDGVASGLE